MKLSKIMLDNLSKFGEHDTDKYHYYISAENGNEYVKRYTVTRYGYMPRVTGKPEKVCVWRGNSWKVF